MRLHGHVNNLKSFSSVWVRKKMMMTMKIVGQKQNAGQKNCVSHNVHRDVLPLANHVYRVECVGRTIIDKKKV
jgi:hypothetical protein